MMLVSVMAKAVRISLHSNKAKLGRKVSHTSKKSDQCCAIDQAAGHDENNVEGQ